MNPFTSFILEAPSDLIIENKYLSLSKGHWLIELHSCVVDDTVISPNEDKLIFTISSNLVTQIDEKNCKTKIVETPLQTVVHIQERKKSIKIYRFSTLQIPINSPESQIKFTINCYNRPIGSNRKFGIHFSVRRIS